MKTLAARLRRIGRYFFYASMLFLLLLSGLLWYSTT